MTSSPIATRNTTTITKLNQDLNENLKKPNRKKEKFKHIIQVTIIATIVALIASPIIILKNISLTESSLQLTINTTIGLAVVTAFLSFATAFTISYENDSIAKIIMINSDLLISVDDNAVIRLILREDPTSLDVKSIINDVQKNYNIAGSKTLNNILSNKSLYEILTKLEKETPEVNELLNQELIKFQEDEQFKNEMKELIRK